MKRLVICCDGTWNAPTDVNDGVPVPTNVAKFRNALSDTDETKSEQRVYYHPGVGVGANALDKAIDGATGRGLGRNIASAYKWLCDNYESGDEIFAVGFSRGAFTIRSLIGLISRCGLPSKANWVVIDEAYDLYRLDPLDPATELARQAFRRKYASEADPPIAFVGVWDTVGALGIPHDIDWLGLEARRFQFHNTTLSPHVKVARHALAIDEQRSNFAPTLWTGAIGTDQDVAQVWFPGVHADVGGGYKEAGLSDAGLLWMIQEAAKCNASFKPAMVSQIRPDAQDVLHNSYAGLFHFASCQPRSFPRLEEQNPRSTGQALHPSVLDRVKSPPIEQAPYRETLPLSVTRPQSVLIFAREFWNWTGLYLNAGTTYSFDVSGSWQDAHHTTGPEGMATDLTHWLASSIKRVPDAPWFCLIGAIGDAGNPDNQGNPAPMTCFAIGKGKVGYTVETSGYLYGFVNDAVNPIGAKSAFYNNNRGCVSLVVTCLT